jgi:hypothetical protein
MTINTKDGVYCGNGCHDTGYQNADIPGGTFTAPTVPGVYKVRFAVAVALLFETGRNQTYAGYFFINVVGNSSVGYLDLSRCHEFYGWACDPSTPNTPVEVQIYNGRREAGGVLLSSAMADKSRPDVAGICGNGDHGFVMPPSSVLSDPSYNIYAYAVKNGIHTLINETPKQMSCLVASSFDMADCNQGFVGWACDSASPSKVYQTQIYSGPRGSGGSLLASGAANVTRESAVGAICGGNSDHGFLLSTPESVWDGVTRDIYSYVTDPDTGNTKQVGTKIMQCTPNVPIGFMDVADCDHVAGWTCDADNNLQGLQVEVLSNGVVVGTGTANGSRPDIVSTNICGGNGAVGYDIQTPNILKNGATTTITVRAKNIGRGTDQVLFGSKALNCPAAIPFDYSLAATPVNVQKPTVGSARVNSIASKTLLTGTSQSVTLTVTNLPAGVTIAPIIPNPSNPSVNPSNNVNIPFVVSPSAVPGTYNVTLTGTSLNTAPKTVTIPLNITDVPPINSPIGYLDYAGCDNIAGWTCDADIPNSALSVHLYDGSTFISPANANLSRTDLVGVCGGTSVAHGFVIPTPLAFKDGIAHNVNVWGVNIGTTGSNVLLTGSPKSLTCPSSVFDYSLAATPINVQKPTTGSTRVDSVVSKTLLTGTTQAVTLTLTSLPPVGVSVQQIIPNPSNPSANPANNVNIPFLVSSNAIPGRTYNVTFTGTSLNTAPKTVIIPITITSATPVPTPVNGSCGTSHYNCSAGSSANNIEGPTSYTWTCNGSNGGSNVSCSENKTTPPPGGTGSCYPTLQGSADPISSAKVGQTVVWKSKVGSGFWSSNNATFTATAASDNHPVTYSTIGSKTMYLKIGLTAYKCAVIAADGTQGDFLPVVNNPDIKPF